ncbi:MAG: UDP-N-acetylmuramate dehydrogenase [bacterium]|nr:UDP-N-acetylmuramate dehydrogenase [bacterium]
MNPYSILELNFGKGKIQKDKNISSYITLRTETVAEYFIEAETKEDWLTLFHLTHEHTIPLFIIGGGSNLAILQNKINGLVVRNLYVIKEVVNDTAQYVDLLVSSGYPMGRLVKETAEAGYEGFEYHLGLPGTLGGAIYMNSKWTHPLSYAGDWLIKGFLIDNEGALKEVDRNYFQFAYDHSKLQETKEFFLEGIFRLQKQNPAILKNRSQEALAYRKQTQPFGVATSGCFFQNISEEEKNRLGFPTGSAGYLIDQAGLKHTQVGDFIVSPIHANFIVNQGEGKPEDLIQLIHLIKAKVKEQFGVDLKEEVRII